jgi:hypothetical protein
LARKHVEACPEGDSRSAQAASRRRPSGGPAHSPRIADGSSLRLGALPRHQPAPPGSPSIATSRSCGVRSSRPLRRLSTIARPVPSGRARGRSRRPEAATPSPSLFYAASEEARCQIDNRLGGDGIEPPAGPRLVHTPSEPSGSQRSPAVSSGRSFVQVAGAILRKQARGQNPDKDEVPGSSPGRPTTSSNQPKCWSRLPSGPVHRLRSG